MLLVRYIILNGDTIFNNVMYFQKKSASVTKTVEPKGDAKDSSAKIGGGKKGLYFIFEG